MKRRRKYELKLLRAAAVGSTKKVKRLLARDDPSSSSSESESEHRKRKRRNASKEHVNTGSEASTSDTDSENSRKRHRRKQQHRKHKKRRKKSIDVNCQDLDGWAPLHHAAFANSPPLIDFLLSKGAKVHITDYKGNTPLHIAAKSGYAQSLAALRKAGGLMTTPNHLGQTPEHLVMAAVDRLHRRQEAQARGSRFVDPAGWDDKLEAELSGGEDFKGMEWGVPAEAQGDPAPDSDWFGSVAESMAKKRKHDRARFLDEVGAAESARRARAEDEAERRLKWETERAARQAEAQRVLEEEQAKDKAWRQEVHKAKAVRQQDSYFNRWAEFAESQNVKIGYKDVPFPVEPGKEAELGQVVLLGVTALADRKKRLREEVMRWHPDKFNQKWGRRLDEKQKEKILSRVKEVSQAVHDLYKDWSEKHV